MRENSRNASITTASVLFYFHGLAQVLTAIPVALFIWQNRRPPVVFGIPLEGGGIFERLGPDAMVAANVPWLAINALEVLAGHWLWRSEKRGGKLGLWLVPPSAAFWIGFALPYPPMLASVRLILLAIGWRPLR